MTTVIDPQSTEFVSVILPTFNRAHCLRRAMRSVLAQTHSNFELIVADDASTDATEALVKGWDDPRIVYMRHEKNQGASAARNLGLTVARGPLIAFQDSDDEWLLDKLERQISTLRESGAEVGATFGYKIIYGRDMRRVLGAGRVAIAPDNIYSAINYVSISHILRKNLISPQTLMLRSDVARKIGPFDTRLPSNNDWEYMIRLCSEARVSFLNEPVAMTYIQKDSISQNSQNAARSYLIILKKHWRMFEAEPDVLSGHLFRAGRHLQSLKRHRAASKCFRRAIVLKPNRVAPLIALCRSLVSAALE